MGSKGEKTKQLICRNAYQLFAEIGYKDVTMKDICEKTGLSRGGLYRHFSSTEEIFLEIMTGLLNNQQQEFALDISNREPAAKILYRVLERYKNEMIDSASSLSIAIYEFFSNPQIAESNQSILQQYLASRDMWISLITYGIETGEFKKVEPEAVFDLIVFSYQGVRMYSRLMPVTPDIPERIIRQIKQLLLPETGGH